MKFMLDTNICIYLIKRHSQRIIEHVTKHATGEIGISSITLAELNYGVAKSLHKQQNRTALKGFVMPLEIASFDDRAAESYGLVRSQLEKAGKPIGALDTLIGAHALSLGVTLVTNNLREFKRIKGLKVVDWSV
jgi:tRNA(fMet)-specific endonuclease VapC